MGREAWAGADALLSVPRLRGDQFRRSVVDGVVHDRAPHIHNHDQLFSRVNFLYIQQSTVHPLCAGTAVHFALALMASSVCGTITWQVPQDTGVSNEGGQTADLGNTEEGE